MYDLIIVGAGPAGSSAARTAAKLGLSTLLLEKEKVPRDKLCGGGVTPKVLKLLDFNIPDELVECKSKSTRIHVGEECFRFETDKTLVYMTSRTKFDTYLTEKAVEAGAELRDGTPVQSVGVTESYSEAKTSAGDFKSKMLIGADGMGGPTASSVHLYDRWKASNVSYAIESEVPVGERSVQDFVSSNAYFDVHFGVSPAGYGWVFPKDDHLTVGVGCRLSNLRDAQGLFNGFVKRLPEIEGRTIPKPKAHLIPLGGAANVPYVADRVLLAGDSAGFAEPLLGEGIYFSILGAQLAAQTAAEACENESFDDEFLSKYTERCRAAFQSDFDMAYRMARVSYLEQNDMERVARLFFSNRRFQEFIVGTVDGSVRYRDAPVKLAWLYFKYRLSKIGFPV